MRVVHVRRLQVAPQSVAVLLQLAAPFRIPETTPCEAKKQTAGVFESLAHVTLALDVVDDALPLAAHLAGGRRPSNM